MAIAIPAAPNYNVTPPQLPNPIAQQTALANLANMKSESALRQQLAPLDVQEAQQRVQQQTTANQVSQLQLQTMNAQNAYWSNPEQYAVDDPKAQPGNDKIATLLGVAADDPILAMVHGQMKAGVPGNAAIADAKATLDFRQNVAKATQDQQKVLDDAHSHMAKIAAPILAEQDPAKKAQMIQDAMPGIAEWAKFDPSIAQNIKNLNVQNFDAFANRLGAEQDALDYRTKSADAWAKELTNNESVNPLLKIAVNPTEAFSGDKLPASIAYLQSRVKDADPKIATQATQLLGQAKAAQGVQLSIDKAKKEAEQRIADGDPESAGQLLFDGTVAPSQLISSRKPEFAQKAFAAAAKLGQQAGTGWNAQKAEADFNVAKSPANIAFFGSAKSLTDPGGTLDQLAAASKDIPSSEIPVINTIADVMKLQTGDPKIAKYATIAWGVSDDAAKVQGGGQGSDKSRADALALVTGKQSPEQRLAAINAIRGTVGSQVQSRIGNNTVMKQMYGSQNNAKSSAGGEGGHVIKIGNDYYQYSGTGDTADVKSYKKLAGNPNGQ